MKSIAATAVHVHGRSTLARLRAVVPVALLLGGLFTVWPGPFTAPVAAAAVPGAPTGVTADGGWTGWAGSGSVAVSWTAPISDGGSPIVIYSVVSSPASPLSPTGANCSTPVTNCVVSGLINDVNYTFTVRAWNSVGAGPVSAASNAYAPRQYNWQGDHALSGISWQDAKLHADYEEQGATLALEPDGTPAFFFNRMGSGAGIVRAVKTASGWKRSKVSTVTAADESKPWGYAYDQYQDAVIDSAGVSHVVYIDPTGDVVYATDAGGSWARTVIGANDDNGDPYGMPSIALDASRRPIVTWSTMAWGSGNAGDGMFVAVLSPSGWGVTHLTQEYDLYSSVAVDGNGHIDVAFQRGNTGTAGVAGIYYATNASGAWRVTSVSIGESDESPDIAMTSGGPHIAFARADADADAGVYLADLNGSTWSTAQVPGLSFAYTPGLSV